MSLESTIRLDNIVPARTKEETIGTPVCFHCLGLMPRFGNLSLEHANHSYPMCCLGCKSAASYIFENGLMRFYEHRSQNDRSDFFGEVVGHKVKINKDTKNIDQWLFLDSPDSVGKFVTYLEDGHRELTVFIEGIYCNSCTWLIDQALDHLSSDIDFQANIDSKSARISINDDNVKLSEVLSTIASLGYRPSIPETGDTLAVREFIRQQKNSALMRIAVAGFGMMQVMTYATAGYFGGIGESNFSTTGMDHNLERFFLIISMLVATVVVFYSGRPFFLNAINDLRNKHLGMDVTVSLAIMGAYFPSVYQVLSKSMGHVYFDSAVMFVFFLSLGRFVEMQSRHRLSLSTNDVQDLLPQTLIIQRYQNDQLQVVEIKPTDVLEGDQIHIATSDIVPFDGSVKSGVAQFDESLATGESKVVTKSAGQPVIAGSSLVSGNVLIQSSGCWSDSSVAKIQHALARAEKSSCLEKHRAKIVNRWFILSILCLTVIVGIIWWLIEPTRLFEVCLAMLIASCPCAFALAVPVGRSAAISRLRRSGVLVTNNTVLSSVPRITTWCLDKTGTLTTGRPEVCDVICHSDVSADECMKIISSIEKSSSHVLASAFSSIRSPYVATEIKEAIGQGIEAMIGNDCYFVGSRKWLEGRISSDYSLKKSNNDSEILLVKERELLAAVYVKDHLRPSAQRLVSRLKKADQNIVILSGDHAQAAKDIGDKLGIDQIESRLLPEHKLEKIRRLQNKGEKVVMIGDGINDAPVLAQAYISIGLASGADIALHNSDVVLLNGNLDNIGVLIDVAMHMNKVTRQNFVWALTYNCLALPLAASGLLTPWIAAIGMSLSSLLVVLNALTLQVNKWK